MGSSHRAFVRVTRQARTRHRGHGGGANRDRTGDLLVANQTLSQLSYGPLLIWPKLFRTILADITSWTAGKKAWLLPAALAEDRAVVAGKDTTEVVGLGGVAPPTSPLSGVRSN